MPKFTKCWFKDCDSDNREDSKILFYKFPKDLERCGQWVGNCANPELTEIWTNNPLKVGTLRICQKHFLREFLGSSCRLVGHAVPAPHGVPLECLNAEKFMVECASLKCTSSFNTRRHRYEPQHQSQEQLMPSDACCQTNLGSSACQNVNYLQPSVDMTDINSHNEPPPGLLMIVDQNNYHQQLVDHTLPDTCGNNSADLYTSGSATQYMATYPSNHEQIQTQAQPIIQNMHTINNDNYSYMLPEEHQTGLMSTENNYQPSYRHDQTPELAANIPIVPDIQDCVDHTNRSRRHGNPKINYDRDGKVISIQYPTETLSMLKADDNEQRDKLIEALKHKVYHYQRRLAVTNHRYQKLKAQQKGRSHKTRLLECLKTCRKNFEPCIFEIFKGLIKGPTSKHGNRWSNDVKSFASAIYTRSRSAYKFIRKTIDLPSESIVKRYICDKKLSKLPQNNQALDIDTDEIEDGDDNDCDDGDEIDDDDDYDDVGDDCNDGGIEPPGAVLTSL